MPITILFLISKEVLRVGVVLVTSVRSNDGSTKRGHISDSSIRVVELWGDIDAGSSYLECHVPFVRSIGWCQKRELFAFHLPNLVSNDRIHTLWLCIITAVGCGPQLLRLTISEESGRRDSTELLHFYRCHESHSRVFSCHRSISFSFLRTESSCLMYSIHFIHSLHS